MRWENFKARAHVDSTRPMTAGSGQKEGKRAGVPGDTTEYYPGLKLG